MFNDEEHHTNEDEYFSTSTPLVGVFLGQRRLYMRFLWLGVSSLFPFNILIMTDPYFENKFNVENCTNTSTSTLSLSFENSVMLSCAVAYLLTTIVLTFVFTPYFHKYRIYTSLLGIIVCLMICFVFTFIDVQRWRDGFFLLFMIVVAIESIFNGILLNCVFSLASMLPSSFLQVFWCGQSLSGVFASVCSIIAISLFDNSPKSSEVYFPMAIIGLLFSGIFYYRLEKSSLLQIYGLSSRPVNREDEPLLQGSSSYHDDDQNNEFDSIGRRKQLLIVYQQIKWLFWSTFLTHLISSIVYPGVLSKVRSRKEDGSLWSEFLFTPVMCFFLFTLNDTFGRLIAIKFRQITTPRPKILFAVCSSRSIFLIFFGFCHFSKSNNYPDFFKSDVFFAVLVVIFSLSHGFFSSLSLSYAPKRVQSQFRAATGALLLLALVSGICVGSALSFVVLQMSGLNEASSKIK